MESESESGMRRGGAGRRLAAMGAVLGVALLALALIGQAASASSSAVSPQAAPPVVRADVSRVQYTSICCDNFDVFNPPAWTLGDSSSGPRWNLVTNTLWYGKSHSGARAMWFGDPATGEFGGEGCDMCPSYAGSLTAEYTVPITSTDSKAYLTFWSWEQTEMSIPTLECYQKATCDFDSRQVWVSSNLAPTWVKKWDTRVNPTVELTWHQVTIDISEYRGHSVRVRFVFDTIDGRNNDAGVGPPAGWFVDDIGYFTYTPSNTIYLPIIGKNATSP